MVEAKKFPSRAPGIEQNGYHITDAKRPLVAQDLMVTQVSIDSADGDQDRPITAFSGASPQTLIDLDDFGGFPGRDGFDDLFVEQVGCRLEGVWAADDQSEN